MVPRLKVMEDSHMMSTVYIYMSVPTTVCAVVGNHPLVPVTRYFLHWGTYICESRNIDIVSHIRTMP